MVAVSITISAIVALILGFLVLAFPGLLRWAVGIYLIFVGIMQLIGQYY